MIIKGSKEFKLSYNKVKSIHFFHECIKKFLLRHFQYHCQEGSDQYLLIGMQQQVLKYEFMIQSWGLNHKKMFINLLNLNLGPYL